MTRGTNLVVGIAAALTVAACVCTALAVVWETTPEPTHHTSTSATETPRPRPLTRAEPTPVAPPAEVSEEEAPVVPPVVESEPVAPAPVDPWVSMTAEQRLSAAIDAVRPYLPVDGITWLVQEQCTDGWVDSEGVGGCYTPASVELPDGRTEADRRIVIHPRALSGEFSRCQVGRLLVHEGTHYLQAVRNADLLDTRALETEAYDRGSEAGVALGCDPMPASEIPEYVLRGGA